MFNKTLITLSAATLALATTASAQTVPFPTSESVAGNFDTPIVIIPESAIPREPSSFESQQSADTLVVSVSSSALTAVDLDLPRAQTDLLNIIAFSAFGAPLDSVTEGASDIEG